MKKDSIKRSISTNLKIHDKNNSNDKINKFNNEEDKNINININIYNDKYNNYKNNCNYRYSNNDKNIDKYKDNEKNNNYFENLDEEIIFNPENFNIEKSNLDQLKFKTVDLNRNFMKETMNSKEKKFKLNEHYFIKGKSLNEDRNFKELYKTLSKFKA